MSDRDRMRSLFTAVLDPEPPLESGVSDAVRHAAALRAARRRRWASVVAVGVAAVVLVAVASQVLLGRAWFGAVPPAGPSQVDTERVYAHASQLRTQVMGGRVERGSADFLRHYAANIGYLKCMKEHGQAWTLRIPNEWYPETTPLSGTAFLDPVNLTAVSDVRRVEDDRPKGDEPPGGRTELTDECAALDPFSDQDPPAWYENNGIPADVVPVIDAFNAAIGEASRPLDRYQGQYEECMGNHGYKSMTGYTDVIDALSGPVPSGPAPRDGQPLSPEWQAYLRLEHDTLTADADCRAPMLAEGLPLLAAALDRFETDHVDDIRNAARSWKQQVEHAKSLGYDPTRRAQTIE